MFIGFSFPNYQCVRTGCFKMHMHNSAKPKGKPKGDGGKGTGKKTSRQFVTNVTTIYDILRSNRVGSKASVGYGTPPLQPGAVPAPKCDPLREVSANSPSQRAAYRQLPSPRGRYYLPSAEVSDPLREVVQGQPSHHYFEVVFSQLLREDIC